VEQKVNYIVKLTVSFQPETVRETYLNCVNLFPIKVNRMPNKVTIFSNDVYKQKPLTVNDFNFMPLEFRILLIYKITSDSIFVSVFSTFSF